MHQEQKQIVFDMDDVMWDLNRHVLGTLSIPYEKLTTYSIYENPNIAEKEKELILHMYQNTDTYNNIKFCDRIINLINRIYKEYPEYGVKIVSNCCTAAIRDAKMEQLLNVLVLPKEDIHLHVIDIKTETLKKKLPENVFLFVDDSPYNILVSNARYKIMPAKPYNDVMPNVIRPETEEELEKVIIDCIT